MLNQYTDAQQLTEISIAMQEQLMHHSIDTTHVVHVTS